MIFFLFFLLTCDTTPLYNTLHPNSISQHLDFYTLYPESAEGKQALEEVSCFIQTTREELRPCARAFLQLLHKTPPSLPRATIQSLQKLGAKLPNRSLKGFLVSSEQEIE